MFDFDDILLYVLKVLGVICAIVFTFFFVKTCVLLFTFDITPDTTSCSSSDCCCSCCLEVDNI